MKRNYLLSAFETTLAERFPEQAEGLRAALNARLERLRAENAGASPEKRRHLEGQILPGIAVYETLQTVLPKEEALKTVHGYVEARVETQTRHCEADAHSRALSKSAGHFFKTDAEAVRRDGGVRRAGNSDDRRRVAH